MLLDQTAALRLCIHHYRDTLPALAPHSDAIQYALEHDNPQAAGALSGIQRFMHNIDVNFGADSTAYQQIQDTRHRDQRKQQIIQALLGYRKSRNAWDQLFADN